ncbi:SDR family NAD(P)-dependent oxidoreductase [Sphaerisporangium dianthi]|uniref:SDR family NAD(P)-dependent oxidoreductase n=1 Tax=Sphaerisporangium dianthi TaxID=1436120 RepID=A0ABV9CI70_9ACTN
MTYARVALVTGANKGIGLALVECLSSRLGPGDLVLLTGRSAERVSAAVALVAGSPATTSEIQGRVLDVSDADAVAAMAAELGDRYGGVDIVVSNASAMLTPDRPQSAQAEEFIGVANGGAHAVLRSFGPLLRPGGRLVVVASSLGTLGHLDPRLRPLFDGASLDEVEKAVASWLSAIHAGTSEELGWPRWLNVPSKVAQVAAVRAVAAERRADDLPRDILVAAVCPGLVDTPLSRPWFSDFSQARTPAQAAVPIVDLLLSAPMNPEFHGELVRSGHILPWPHGTPPRAQDLTLAP